MPFDCVPEVRSSGSSTTVLVVDDEPLIADTITAILIAHGFLQRLPTVEKTRFAPLKLCARILYCPM
jgi:hypothetical protein